MNFQDSACQIKLWSTASNEFSWLDLTDESWRFDNSQATTSWPTPALLNSYSLYSGGCELLLMNKTHFSFFLIPISDTIDFYVSTFCYRGTVQKWWKLRPLFKDLLVLVSVTRDEYPLSSKPLGTSSLFTLLFCPRSNYATLELLKFSFKL